MARWSNTIHIFENMFLVIYSFYIGDVEGVVILLSKFFSNVRFCSFFSLSFDLLLLSDSFFSCFWFLFLFTLNLTVFSLNSMVVGLIT